MFTPARLAFCTLTLACLEVICSGFDSPVCLLPDQQSVVTLMSVGKHYFSLFVFACATFIQFMLYVPVMRGNSCRTMYRSLQTLGKTMLGLIGPSHRDQASPPLSYSVIISPEFTRHLLWLILSHCRASLHLSLPPRLPTCFSRDSFLGGWKSVLGLLNTAPI